MSNTNASNVPRGFLGWIERAGNRLPDPVFLFLYLIVALVVISVACVMAGVSAVHPTQVAADGNAVVIRAVSLLSPENLQRLLGDMPKTFTAFHPLGYVLVVMLGAGVAERSGLFGTAIRAAVRGAPKFLLTPVVALVAMISNHAADAGYVVLIPLAAVLYASVGRHPLAGIAAGQDAAVKDVGGAVTALQKANPDIAKGPLPAQVSDTIPALIPEGSAALRMDGAQWDALADWMRSKGLIKDQAAGSDAIDPGLLPESSR
jgi:p-aminobenzoyl-glutamate transporter AbgT